MTKGPVSRPTRKPRRRAHPEVRRAAARPPAAAPAPREPARSTARSPRDRVPLATHPPDTRQPNRFADHDAGTQGDQLMAKRPSTPSHEPEPATPEVRELPLVALRETVIFPEMIVPLQVGREK